MKQGKRGEGRRTGGRKRRSEEEAEEQSKQGKTSEREYEVDAQALKAEEGRGDRRNVQGELHASEEP